MSTTTPEVASTPDDVPALARLRLGRIDGNVTTVGFGYEPGHDDIDVIRNANHEDLTDHSKRQRNWLLSLPEEHQPYWTHINEVDHLWPNHGDHPPVWVSCPEHPALEQAIADHFSNRGHQVKIGEPGSDEPPPSPPSPPSGGTPPSAPPGPSVAGIAGTVATAATLIVLATIALWALLRSLLAGFSNDGADWVARLVGGDLAANSFTGSTTSAPTVTTVTNTGAAFPASSAGANGVHQGGLVGHIVTMATAYGVVISNTTTVLTIDMWHTLGNPDTVATTPSTGAYYILPGQAPAMFAGPSTATRAFNAADQFLSNDGTTISEVWSAAGGIKRKLTTWAHTTGTGTFTWTVTWTANGSDSLPSVLDKVGYFLAEVTAAPSAATSGPMPFDYILTQSATLAASGDNVTVTNTMTESGT